MPRLFGDQSPLLFVAAKVGAGILGATFVPIAVRAVGTEAYGRLTIALFIASAFGALAASWYSTSLLRWPDWSQPEVPIRPLLGLGAGAATAFALSTGVGDVSAPLLASSVLAFCVAWYIPSIALLQRRSAGLPLIRTEITRTAIPLVVATIGLVVTLDVSVLLLGLGIGYLAGSAVALRARTLQEPEASGDRRQLEVAMAWRYGGPMAVWFFLAQAMAYSDRIIIDYFLTDLDVGVYSTQYDLVTRTYALSLAPLVSWAHPRFMRAKDAGLTLEAATYLRWAGLAVAIAWAAGSAVALSAAGRSVIEAVADLPAEANTSVLLLLVASGALGQLANLSHKELEWRERTFAMALLMLAATLINVGLNLALVPRYGVVAAAATSAIAYLLYGGAGFAVGSVRRSGS